MLHVKSFSGLTFFLVLLTVLSTLGWSFKSSAQNYRKNAEDIKAESLTSLLLADGNARGKSEDEIVELAKKAEGLISSGNYLAATLIWEQIAIATEKRFGLEHLDTARSLNQLALLYVKQGAYGKAEVQFIRSLRMHEKVLDAQHPDIATALYNLGNLYSDLGAYEKAKPLLVRALAIREKVLGLEHPETAASLNNLAFLYQKQGNYDQAAPLFVRALAINEKTLGPEHLETATNLNNLAYFYLLKGSDFDKAESLFARAIMIKVKMLGPDHPSTAKSINSLGQLYSRKGEFAKAQPLFVRSLAINEKALGPDHPDTAMSVTSLASLYGDMGDYDKAEQLFVRGKKILEKAFGSEHPYTLTSLSNLASLYVKKSAYSKAEPLLLKVLSGTKKVLGAGHPDTAVSLNNLAFLYQELGALGKAASLYRESLAILEKILGRESPDIAKLLNNLAYLYLVNGGYAKAERLYVRALAINKKALGQEHPETAIIINSLAGLYNEQNLNKKSDSYLRAGVTIELGVVQREAPYIPRVDRQRLLASFGDAYLYPFSFADRRVGRANLALFSRLNRNGLLEEIEQRQFLLTRLPGLHRKFADQLKALNIQLSAATLKPEQRQNLRRDQADVEQRLYRLIPELKPRIVEVEQVSAALPKGSALVEFQKYKPLNVRKLGNQRWGESHYLALVLKPDNSITAVQLGAAAPIEYAIHKALDASVQNNSDASELWAQVSARVLKPLLPAFTSIRQLFVSPDSELHRVPFGALPDPQSPSYPLADAVQLHVLTSGRDLLRFLQPAKPAQAPVVFANPNFDRVVRSANVIAAASKDDQRQSRSVDFSAKTWSPLVASEREGQQVGTLLATRPITGNDATTGRLQQLIAPRVLHIASHGFFVGGAESKPNDQLVSLRDQSAMLRSFRDRDPQLQSGLVLAGANQPDADPNDDGYLTAAEAVGLQLDGTELVVLSACSTGQGSVRTGEGVYGLQRSLTVAGARSTLLSLWKVDDAATSEFMTRFYKRLKAGEGRSDALAATQKEFREGLAGKGEWKKPYYWAAWQLVGDWRPIKGL